MSDEIQTRNRLRDTRSVSARGVPTPTPNTPAALAILADYRARVDADATDAAGDTGTDAGERSPVKRAGAPGPGLTFWVILAGPVVAFGCLAASVASVAWLPFACGRSAAAFARRRAARRA